MLLAMNQDAPVGASLKINEIKDYKNGSSKNKVKIPVLKEQETMTFFDDLTPKAYQKGFPWSELKILANSKNYKEKEVSKDTEVGKSVA